MLDTTEATRKGLVHPPFTFHELSREPPLSDSSNGASKPVKPGQDEKDEPSAKDISVHAELKEHLTLVRSHLQLHRHIAYHLSGSESTRHTDFEDHVRRSQ